MVRTQGKALPGGSRSAHLEALALPMDSCQRLVDSVTSRVLQQLQVRALAHGLHMRAPARQFACSHCHTSVLTLVSSAFFRLLLCAQESRDPHQHVSQQLAGRHGSRRSMDATMGRHVNFLVSARARLCIIAYNFSI